MWAQVCPTVPASLFLLNETVLTNYTGTEVSPETDLADLARILPYFYQPEISRHGQVDMSWYSWWVREQLDLSPDSLLSALPGHGRAEKAVAFVDLWHALGRLLSDNTSPSIDHIVQYLIDDKKIEEPADSQGSPVVKSLVFATIGWQTMLFRGDHGSGPSTTFAIVDEMSGHQGRGIMKLRYPQTCSREPLSKCLLCFGVLLPPKNYDLAQSPEHRRAFIEYKEVDTTCVNASMLVNVGRLQLKWTDCMACHLELDLATNSVYLFRYPSFCVASRAVVRNDKTIRGPIYACAQQDAGSSMWAKQDEVTDLLDEILMTFRLLFGQSKQSRKLFRRLSPFAGAPVEAQDTLLLDLCGRKHPRIPLFRGERKTWNLEHDFPILRSRLSTLAYEMSNRKPRTWKELWKDKRDEAQWATFWVVIIFGAIGLCLSAIQVVLQAVQLGIQR